MNSLPTITLCMIVKDEAQSLERCLKSVKGVVQETIIVDTGSTDQSKEICAKYGAKLYSYEWKNSFADARNYGVSLATSDWIMWLDADEELDQHEKLLIRDFLAKTNSNIVSLPVLNYYGTLATLNDKNVFMLYQPRLFRNHLGIKFQNRIHEELTVPAEKRTNEKLTVSIHHYGYLEDIVDRKQKSQRNIQLLKRELNDPEHHPWIEYYLAGEFYRISDYKLAFEYVNQSIVSFLKRKLMPPSFLYKLKYGILIDTESIEGAWPGIEKAILLYPDYVDLYYYKGLILYKMERFQEAIEAFEKCLDLGDYHTEYLILKGAGSFRALEYKELCLEKLKIKTN
jgi:glycosyltransferase involved in cell wall biosynthesis